MKKDEHLSFKTRLFNVIRWLILKLVGERFLLRLSMNRPLGSRITKVLPNCYQYPKHSIRDVTRDELLFRLDISDFVQWVIFWGFQTMNPLLELVKKDDIIIDAGANIGYTALRMGQKVGDTGKIFAFEPVPTTFKLLDYQLELNNRPQNIAAFNLGLSDRKQQLQIVEAQDNNIGMNHVVSETEMNLASIPIECTTIDEWVANQSLNRIDLIKIDVEGFELHVLMGAEITLKTFAPTLFIEMDDQYLARYGKSCKEMLMFLENLGYNVYESGSGKRISSAGAFINYHNDIIAKHHGKN